MIPVAYCVIVVNLKSVALLEGNVYGALTKEEVL